MEYRVYNKLSKKGNKIDEKNIVDITTLDEEFYKKLTSEDEVYIYGGDGTINKFINNCEQLPKITIVKTGTGNDLSRNLTTKYQKVSIFEVNGIRYINGFDVGFGALVCKLVNEDENKNDLSYMKNVYRGMKDSKLIDAKLQIDENVYDTTRNFLITAQNGKYFGGGMAITPKANIMSDSVEVCLINNAPKLLVLALFPSVFLGKHNIFKKYVKTYTGNQVTITLNEPYIGECDGEVLNPTTVFKISHAGYIYVRNG